MMSDSLRPVDVTATCRAASDVTAPPHQTLSGNTGKLNASITEKSYCTTT